MALGEVEPDIAAIENGLTRLENPKIAALVTCHSHLDHAMDVAEVAKRTGALLVGSESTANIGRGGGLAERQIKVVRDGETLRFGDFAMTMIISRHFASPNAAFQEADPIITEPLAPPASAYAYRGALPTRS
jgi:L-ascorbate metabolism protein UlaG (beta-lactamase superfamily)